MVHDLRGRGGLHDHLVHPQDGLSATATLLVAIKCPTFVRPLSNVEREASKGLRSSDTFVLRRCQILLASSWSENACRMLALWAATSRPLHTRDIYAGLRAPGLKGSTANKPHVRALG